MTFHSFHRKHLLILTITASWAAPAADRESLHVTACTSSLPALSPLTSFSQSQLPSGIITLHFFDALSSLLATSFPLLMIYSSVMPCKRPDGNSYTLRCLCLNGRTGGQRPVMKTWKKVMWLVTDGATHRSLPSWYVDSGASNRIRIYCNCSVRTPM